MTGVEGKVSVEDFLEAIRKKRSFVLGTESNLLNKAVSTLGKEARIMAHKNSFSVLKGQAKLNVAHYRDRWRNWVGRGKTAKRL